MWSWQLTTTSAKVKNEQSYTSTPPFMAYTLSTYIISPVLIILRPFPLNQFQNNPPNITRTTWNSDTETKHVKYKLSSIYTKKIMPYLIAIGSKTHTSLETIWWRQQTDVSKGDSWVWHSNQPWSHLFQLAISARDSTKGCGSKSRKL